MEIEKGSEDWRKLAFALDSLAHNDERDFDALEQRLKETEIGKLCAAYTEARDHEYIDRAGHLLTGTDKSCASTSSLSAGSKSTSRTSG